MRLIPLTQGKHVMVDDDDYEYLMQWKWYAHKMKGGIFYARRSEIKDGKKSCITMHRVILGITDKSILVDHKNHNGLDNTKSNIRSCTRTQNNTNKTSERNSVSKYLGVCWFARKQRWFSSIRYNKKLIHLGSFKDEKDAALAYNAKATELHGEFANLNIVLN